MGHSANRGDDGVDELHVFSLVLLPFWHVFCRKRLHPSASSKVELSSRFIAVFLRKTKRINKQKKLTNKSWKDSSWRAFKKNVANKYIVNTDKGTNKAQNTKNKEAFVYEWTKTRHCQNCSLQDRPSSSVLWSRLAAAGSVDSNWEYSKNSGRRWTMTKSSSLSRCTLGRRRLPTLSAAPFENRRETSSSSALHPPRLRRRCCRPRWLCSRARDGAEKRRSVSGKDSKEREYRQKEERITKTNNETNDIRIQP